MEFSLQPEDYLDQTFGLSAEILAADLNTDGGILDLGHSLGDGLKPQYPVSTLTGTDESIDDLLFQDADGGSFGEDWMETVDLSVFLDSDNSVIPTAVPPPVVPVTQKIEAKNNAFELLKSLLTGAISEVQPPATVVPPSPEAEVPDINFFTDNFLSQPEEQLNAQAETSVVKVEIKSENEQNTIIDFSQVDLASPISSDDIESLLSSGPSSPNESVTLHTVDTSQLDESFSSTSESSFFDKGIGQDVVIRESKRKSKKPKSRSSPYDSDDGGVYYDRKDRKKMQNKNAATRYRVKKRMEKETLQEQENSLSDKNKGLREKVESLQREIAYMKELMNEIYKAKGVKREIV